MSRTVDRHWERALGYLHARQADPARAQWESLRVHAPGDARTHIVGTRLALLDGRPGDAAAQALEAARLVDDAHSSVLVELVDTLLQTGESATAHELLATPPWERARDPHTLLRYADFLRRLGDHARALVAVEHAMAMDPANPQLHHIRAQELQFLGRLDEAESGYKRCLALDPGFAYAAYGLARVRRQTAGNHCLALIEAGRARARPGSRAQADFEFARYHALEDLGQVNAAWQALATANSVMHAMASADVARELAGNEDLLNAVAAHPPRIAPSQPDGPCPIFIVGLPRSGTTVLERMLGNHTLVATAGELGDFGQQMLRVANAAASYDADFFARQMALDFGEVGRGYLAQTRWRAGGKPYFTDKRPGNCMMAGLIHAALPAAPILHVVRDPMDACFSVWRARFGTTYAWSYAFESLASHYRQYRRLMRAWHAMHPGAVLDVAYEDLVREPAATLRRVMDFCGLAWEPGCEDITRNPAPVSTLSSVQVRAPVHARAIGQWRHYAAQIEPLRARLVAPP